MKLIWLSRGWPKLTWCSVKGSELTWFLCGSRKWLVLSVWIKISPIFVSWHRSRFYIRMEIQIHLISVMGYKCTWVWCAESKLTWFYCGDRNYLVFVRRSKLTAFLCACRQLPGFSVWIENNLVFVCGPKWLVWGMGIGWLGLCVGGRNWIPGTLLYAGRKSLRFRVSIKFDLVYLCVVEIDLLSNGGGWNLT